MSWTLGYMWILSLCKFRDDHNKFLCQRFSCYIQYGIRRSPWSSIGLLNCTFPFFINIKSWEKIRPASSHLPRRYGDTSSGCTFCYQGEEEEGGWFDPPIALRGAKGGYFFLTKCFKKGNWRGRRRGVHNFIYASILPVLPMLTRQRSLRLTWGENNSKRRFRKHTFFTRNIYQTLPKFPYNFVSLNESLDAKCANCSHLPPRWKSRNRVLGSSYRNYLIVVSAEVWATLSLVPFFSAAVPSQITNRFRTDTASPLHRVSTRQQPNNKYHKAPRIDSYLLFLGFSRNS